MWLDLIIKNQNLLTLPGYPEDLEAGVGWRWGRAETVACLEEMVLW